MSTLVWSIAAAILTLGSITLLKAYTAVPIKELKRRSRKGDKRASALYRVASYGQSLIILLWFFISIFASVFFILITKETNLLIAIICSAVLLFFGFGWLPTARVSKASNILAALFAPPIAGLLSYLRPLLYKLSRFAFNRAVSHSGLYEKEDLIALLRGQKKQTDNRISKEELDIAIGALSFGDKLVSDVLIPRRSVKSVSATDIIGPVLLDELHKQAHSRFPVYQDKPENIVGMLYVRDLIDVRTVGQVKDYMKKDVYYVREDQPLARVLDAFLKTKHHLFIVVNNFEEMVGIITIEDILEQILGKPILDEFDQYEDLRAVAAFDAKKDQENRQEIPEIHLTQKRSKEPEN